MADVTTIDTQAEPEQLAEKQDHSLLWQRLALGGIVLIAVCVNFFQLGVNGFSYYYPPAVKSMMDSWQNFFFASFDPAGFVAIDKPPAGFWLQVLFAKIFGLNPVSILLPQAISGVLAVLLLYYLVRRHFGIVAGLLAALVLALTPISVVTNRSVTIDSTLTLVLLVGAWAVMRAAETGHLRWLLFSAVMVGVGFNIKMLQAYLVVPAYGLLYLLAAPHRLWKRIGHLALAGLLLVLVSLAWVVAVDLTPASQRPYVGSTKDNSALSLALGYNGLSRLLGMGGPVIAGGNGSPSTSLVGEAPTGGFDLGVPGPLRLFDVPLGSQISWLLPLALLGILALAWQKRPDVRTDRKLQSLVLWGTWTLTMGAFFSVAGFFHHYYLVVMAPGVAALCGIGLVTMWLDYRRGGWRGWLLPIALLATAAEQVYLLNAYPDWARWLNPLIIVSCLIVVLVPVSPRVTSRLHIKALNARILAMVLGIGGIVLLVAPTLWAVLPIILSKQAGSLLAGPLQGGGMFISRSGSQAITETIPMSTRNIDPALISYLEANQGQSEFLVAVPSAQEGTAGRIMLETGKPVMAIGGFSGSDPILTAEQFAELVEQGTIRFFLVSSMGLPPQAVEPNPQQDGDEPGQQKGGNGSPGQPKTIGGPGQNNPVVEWVKQHCQVVPVDLWQSVSTKSNSGNENQLYDCAPIR